MSRHGEAPVIAVDVDGVLNPDAGPASEPLGYRPHPYDGPSPTGTRVTGTIWLHPEHGRWLHELAGRGAQLMWNTSWGPLAATWIAPRLGLPQDIAVVEHDHSGVAWGHQHKLFALYEWTGRRPVAVLDDQYGGKDPGDADRRTADGVPTLLVQVDGYTGLRRRDIDQIHAWLNTLAACGDVRDTPAKSRHWPAPTQSPPPNGGPTAAPVHGPPSRATTPRPGRAGSAMAGPGSAGFAPPDDSDADDTDSGVSVGDAELGKTRMLSRQCATCIFRAGNPMHLREGRLRDLIAEARAAQGYIVCHSTLPHYLYPDARPAICRGFADRYDTQALQVISRLWGFVEVDPPGESLTDTVTDPPSNM